MPVPKRKKSRGRRDQRRSHHRLPRLQVQKCPRCSAPKLSHRVCPSCGFLNEKEVIRIEGTP